jgi:hypothetical protein
VGLAALLKVIVAAGVTPVVVERKRKLKIVSILPVPCRGFRLWDARRWVRCEVQGVGFGVSDVRCGI